MTNSMSKYVFNSLQEMLSPRGLGELLGRSIDRLERHPFQVAHLSGNRLEKIIAWGDGAQTSLVLKRFDISQDWVMRLTHDDLVREVALYRHGVYAQLPQGIFVPVIGAARDDDTWASLMLDVSDALPPAAATIVSEEDAKAWLGHLAVLHSSFWNDAVLQNPGLGLSSLEDFLTILAPARVQHEIEAGRANPVLNMAARGWAQFATDAPDEVLKIVQSLQENPTPLLDELAALPQTLVHGDYKLANLGIYRSGKDARSVVLDWQDAARGAGVLDLGYFLALNAARFPFSKAQAIETYRTALQTYGHNVSSREMQLGLLAGGAMRLLWLMVANKQNDLEWWYDLVRQFNP